MVPSGACQIDGLAGWLRGSSFWDDLSMWFKEACIEAGILNKSAHGLRKAAATRAAEKGATAQERERPRVPPTHSRSGPTREPLSGLAGGCRARGIRGSLVLSSRCGAPMVDTTISSLRTTLIRVPWAGEPPANGIMPPSHREFLVLEVRTKGG